ncbi:hypothetical protein [Culicoidibacter larvae]|uniref:Uncharacterized protein n=1 Tax=Culicoidibacter larvae TaxID=2579976 RepID=A0A5R8QAJ2_9FIRM|nr:hypothetical protein [Culicoidibacter larvae]TLG72126.1 hypothetical protein FEZ08_09865 [Culicoidibacter larvae]
MNIKMIRMVGYVIGGILIAIPIICFFTIGLLSVWVNIILLTLGTFLVLAVRFNREISRQAAATGKLDIHGIIGNSGVALGTAIIAVPTIVYVFYWLILGRSSIFPPAGNTVAATIGMILILASVFFNSSNRN